MVRTRFDWFSKGMVRNALERRGRVETDAEVTAEIRRIDLWFTPDSARPVGPDPLGLLGRITAGASTLEFFHATPNGNDLTTCVIKHGEFCRGLVQRGSLAQVPVLWVISAGRPETGIRGLGFHAMAGWPSGLYEGPQLFWTRLVVVSELPATRDTLLMRLLGAERVMTGAIAELKALPEDALERMLALPVLVRLRLDVPADPKQRTSDDEEFLMTTQDIVETWRREAIQEGVRQGLQEGVRQGLQEGVRQGLQEGVRQGLQEGAKQGVQDGIRLSFQEAYEVRFGALPEAIRAVVQDTRDEAKLRAWHRLACTGDAAAIAAAIQADPVR